MSVQFKTLKWCYTHDAWLDHNVYAPDGFRVTKIMLTGNQKLYGVYFSNGKYDILRENTSMQVEKISK